MKKKNITNIVDSKASLRIYGQTIGLCVIIVISFFAILELIDYLFPQYISENPGTVIFIFMIIAAISLALLWIFLRNPELLYTLKSEVEYPKKDVTTCTPDLGKQAKQLYNKIKEIHPNLDFKAVVACADLDYLLPYEVSKLLNKPFTSIHISDEWTKKFNLNPLRYDKISDGDTIIFLLYVASNGRRARQVIPILKQQNIIIKSAFCMHEKKKEAREMFKKNNIPLYSINEIEDGYEDV